MGLCSLIGDFPGVIWMAFDEFSVRCQGWPSSGKEDSFPQASWVDCLFLRWVRCLINHLVFLANKDSMFVNGSLSGALTVRPWPLILNPMDRRLLRLNV